MNNEFLVVHGYPQAAALLRSRFGEVQGKKGSRFLCDEVDLSQGETRCDLNRKIGVILVLSKDLLAVPSTAAFLQQVFHKMKDSDAFLVIPWLYHISLGDLKQTAMHGCETAASLLDTIHIGDELQDVSEVVKAVQKYIEGIFRLRLAAWFGRGQRIVSLTFGYLTGFIVYALGSLMFLVAIVKSQITPGFSRYEAWINLIPGDVMMMLISGLTIVFAVQIIQLWRLKLCGSSMTVLYPSAEIEFRITGAGVLSASLLIHHYESFMNVKNMLVGAGFGLLALSLFRGGCRAKMTPLLFSQVPTELKNRSLLPDLYKRMAYCIAHPGRRFLSIPPTRCFVSYSKSSQWCAETAENLMRNLRGKGAQVFLDRHSLIKGRSWKTQIQEALDNVNVFIIVLDETACKREWVVAEFVHTYLNKMRDASPEMVIVHPCGMDFSALENDRPNTRFFSEIIVQPSVRIPDWMRMKMAEFSPSTVDAMCTAIRCRNFNLTRTGKVTLGSKMLFKSLLHISIIFGSLLGWPLLALPFFTREISGIGFSAISVCLSYPIAAKYLAWWCGCQAGYSAWFAVWHFFLNDSDRNLSGLYVNTSIRGFRSTLLMLSFGYTVWFFSHAFDWQDISILILMVYFGYALAIVSAKEYKTYVEVDSYAVID